MRRGDVCWLDGGLAGERRAVVVLTRDSTLEFLDVVTVAPVTFTVRGIPSEVLLSQEDGMSQECAVNLDHIQTVRKERLSEKITTLTPERQGELRSALIFALGL